MQHALRSDFRWIFVVQLYVASAFSGGAQALSQNTLVHLLLSLLMASSAAMWTSFDAKRRNRRLLPILEFVVFLTWVVSTPTYLIASRGWRGLGWALVHAVCLFAVLIAAFNGILKIAGM
ncbi:MAG: hypothetical protein KDA61_10885 [Planctomycetales bacterium]|nr:hypothetical protein [Planctomycetales bacterium]